MDTNCNLSSLAVYTPTPEKPWNEQRAHHLYRRLAYGASPSLVNAVLQQTPESIVDNLVDEALNVPITPRPDWVNITVNEHESTLGLEFDDFNDGNIAEWRQITVSDQINNSLRALLTIFWHNHFVTEIREYDCAGYAVEYYNVLQENSIGNFKDFVRRIGLTNAMLTYLNGVDNNKNRPNDNYARELYELFTLGEGNGYTEEDIDETAKALTGYNNKNNTLLNLEGDEDKCTLITFSEDTFDNGTKTIFGRSGNFGYDDVIDVLFEEKADLIATFIIGKLYRFFVSANINETIVAELASEFQVDFELEPILRKLFKSEHFFDNEAIGAIIKSPYDLQINFLKVTGINIVDSDLEMIFDQNEQMGQEFYQPVDVAGWETDFRWINSATIVGRWEYLRNRALNANGETLRSFAKEASSNSTDVEFIVRSILDAFLPRGFHTDSYYADAIVEFRGEVPDTHFEDGRWSLDYESVPDQMVNLLQFLAVQPEFQLK